MPLVNTFEDVVSDEPENISTTAEETQESTQEPEMSPDEQHAREGGWRPKEEWDGDESEWVTAREFNKRGELISRIQTQSSQLKKNEKKIAKLEQAINALGEHNKKIADIEKRKLLDDLNRQKYTAINEGDSDKAAELDGLIEQVHNVDTSAPVIEEENEDPNASNLEAAKNYFIQWVERPDNAWYKTNKTLVAAFNVIGADLYNANPSMPLAKLLETAKNKLVEEFPEKFPTKRKNSKVTDTPDETGNRKVKSKYGLKDLPEEARTAAKVMAEQGIMSIEDWVKQYVEANPEDFE